MTDTLHAPPKALPRGWVQPWTVRDDREGSGGDDLVTTVAKMTGGRE